MLIRFFFGILIAINLQTSFLTPPMAMSAYYLKVLLLRVLLVTIFKGCLPYLSMVLLKLVLVYVQPKIVNALPDYFYSLNTEEVTFDVEDPNVIDPSFFSE